jgi:hypothetical protein
VDVGELSGAGEADFGKELDELVDLRGVDQLALGSLAPLLPSAFALGAGLGAAARQT